MNRILTTAQELYLADSYRLSGGAMIIMTYSHNSNHGFSLDKKRTKDEDNRRWAKP
jgi:hypothetical protein